MKCIQVFFGDPLPVRHLQGGLRRYSIVWRFVGIFPGAKAHWLARGLWYNIIRAIFA
jgi:hypothetical protein